MVDVPQLLNKEEAAIDLPPGFRFHPTDEEIITHYLTPKLISHAFTARAIGEVDLNKCEPWDLPSKAKMGGKDHYFFCQRDRKYPTGMRTNRATESGYWKATGKDKEIYRGKGVLVGMKKTLVFYKGRAPKGGKTNWVMHEFRVEGKYSLPNLPKSAKDEWVVSRVFHKTMGVKKSTPPGLESINSYGDDHHLLDSTSWSPLMDPPRMESYVTPSSSFIHSDHIFDSKAPTLTSVGLDSNSQVILSQQNMVSSNPSPQISYYSLLRSLNPDYLHHDEAILPQALVAANNGVAASAMRMHCKMTQYPNPLMDCPLQDVGLSTDRTAEVSSAPIEKLRELGRSMDDDDRLWILTASINGHEGDRLVYN